MKILVTGKTGQVARSLVEAAADFEFELVALGRPDLDLGDVQSIERAVNRVAPDYVVNTAAYTAVDKAEEEGEAASAINGAGAGVLAAVCAVRDIPIIHISSDYVFDGSKDAPYVETDKTNPLGLYGRSKLEGDLAVIAANHQHVILRTAWIYSPFGSNFVKTMLRLAASRDELSVVDDQRGSPSYAPHIASAILQIVEKLAKGGMEKEPWGLYNLASAGEATWCEMAREIFTWSQKLGEPTAIVNPINTEQYPTPAKRPANSRLDCSKLKGVFGVELPDWQDGIADCVARLRVS